METNPDEMKKSGSRFQVARVETKEEQVRESQNENEAADQQNNKRRRKSEDLRKKSVDLPRIDTNIPDSGSDGKHSNGPESPSATFSLSGDSIRSRSSIDGYNKTNCVMNTVEALPCVDHYRNIFSATGGGNLRARPTLAELHEEMDDEELIRKGKGKETGVGTDRESPESPGAKEKVNVVSPVRFGWIQGVLIRCILNIFGVMLFIRLSWVVGNAGIVFSCMIVLLSAVVTTITAISMTAICTNGEVKGGGAYYMISRSLGPEFGGAIGVIFSVANAVAVAMYVVGFAETVRDILVRYDSLMIDEVNDIRIIGSLTITVLLGIALVGMDWEARAQVVLLGILTLAIINFFVGFFLTPTDEQKSKGFLGPNVDLFKTNLMADYEQGQSFFSVFSVFFPAATGILAGANISGDLKDASKSIPKGTFLSILITSLVYLVMAICVGSCVLREANGIMLVSTAAATAASNVSVLQPVSAAVNGSVAMTTTTAATVAGPVAAYSVNTTPFALTSTAAPQYSSEDYSYSPEFISNCSLSPEQCKYGLLYDYQAIEMVAAWGPLILAGIFSATLSSALASLMSAPKVFQALCKDKIFPLLAYFGVGYGPGDNPRRAFLLCFVIGFGFQLIADLNAIAPLISNFFLMSYALINFSCFDASVARSPGWRPSFRFYNKWLSLCGAVLCIVVMFIINWITALITFGCVGTLFVYVHHRKPDVNWGSSTQAHVYRSVLIQTLKLVRIGEHIKNFRPQVLVLSGEPDTRPALVDFCTHITKKMGLMMCGNVIVGTQWENLRQLQSSAPYAYFRRRHIKSFYSATTASTFQLGAQALMQNVGVGKFRPNLLILGYKSNWQTDKPEYVQQYLGVIHDAFDLKFGVGILRVKEGFGLDVDTATTLFDGQQDEDASDDDESPRGTPVNAAEPHGGSSKHSGQEVALNGDVEKGQGKKSGKKGDKKGAAPVVVQIRVEDEEEGQGDMTEQPNNPLLLKKLNTQVLKTMNKFRNKEKGSIDVWWLFDDGGLTLLLPYILTTKAHWRGCRLRVFAAGTKNGDLGYEQRQLATLLSKFRIDCKDMTVLPEINKKPSEESVKMFNQYLSKWRLNSQNGETKKDFPWKVTDDELELVKEKTQRHIRLRELLLERSIDSSLIVMTLPMPRKGTCPAGLYMCWIDTLTRDMPPILLVRGNQTSVLTFYS
ncbi:solute carrier family 12 member 3 [Aplysia californica]|uniref:Solute carrier family 12 member 3 n=2 Tax=Aplysia californica TaxID=6500 RepID=A0ABM1A6S6_APLCA|nr:solute carrier family 12 member 3 [Aplysia californica]